MDALAEYTSRMSDEWLQEQATLIPLRIEGILNDYFEADQQLEAVRNELQRRIDTQTQQGEK